MWRMITDLSQGEIWRNGNFRPAFEVEENSHRIFVDSRWAVHRKIAQILHSHDEISQHAKLGFVVELRHSEKRAHGLHWHKVAWQVQGGDHRFTDDLLQYLIFFELGDQRLLHLLYSVEVGSLLLQLTVPRQPSEQKLESFDIKIGKKLGCILFFLLAAHHKVFERDKNHPNFTSSMKQSAQRPHVGVEPPREYHASLFSSHKAQWDLSFPFLSTPNACSRQVAVA